MDVQLLIGFLLYLFFSPMTTGALRDFGSAMGNSVLRFYAVEHLFGMVVAVIIAHVGARSRAATGPRRQAQAGSHLLSYCTADCAGDASPGRSCPQARADPGSVWGKGNAFASRDVACNVSSLCFSGHDLPVAEGDDAVHVLVHQLIVRRHEDRDLLVLDDVAEEAQAPRAQWCCPTRRSARRPA
jgi:hypothetical protein